MAAAAASSSCSSEDELEVGLEVNEQPVIMGCNPTVLLVDLFSRGWMVKGMVCPLIGAEVVTLQVRSKG